MIIQAAAPVFSKYKYENNVVICKHNILGDRVAFLAWCILTIYPQHGSFFCHFITFQRYFLQSSSCEKIEEDEVCWCLEFPLSLSLSNVECEPQKVFGTEAEAHNYLNIFSLMNNTKYCLLDWVLCVCVCVCECSSVGVCVVRAYMCTCASEQGCLCVHVGLPALCVCCVHMHRLRRIRLSASAWRWKGCQSPSFRVSRLPVNICLSLWSLGPPAIQARSVRPLRLRHCQESKHVDVESEWRRERSCSSDLVDGCLRINPPFHPQKARLALKLWSVQQRVLDPDLCRAGVGSILHIPSGNWNMWTAAQLVHTSLGQLTTPVMSPFNDKRRMIWCFCTWRVGAHTHCVAYCGYKTADMTVTFILVWESKAIITCHVFATAGWILASASVKPPLTVSGFS